MANFVNFVADAANNPAMGKEFVNTLKDISVEDLVSWFKDKGYDLSIDDCKVLVDNKDKIVNMKDITTDAAY